MFFAYPDTYILLLLGSGRCQKYLAWARGELNPQLPLDIKNFNLLCVYSSFSSIDSIFSVRSGPSEDTENTTDIPDNL